MPIVNPNSGGAERRVEPERTAGATMMRNLGGATPTDEPEELKRLANLGLMSMEVAHDLGNLIQVIGSALRLIDRSVKEPTGLDIGYCCAGALLALDRATELRHQILEFARPPDAPPEPVELRSAIAALSNLVVLTAGSNIIVDFFADDSGVTVACDERDLKSVVLNLVANARNAMPDGGRLTITISCKEDLAAAEASSAQNSAVLQVSDTGCGMSADTLARVFEPFFTTRERDGGTGLGLAMVSRIVHRLGGSAHIDSAIGKGTTVTLRLPAAEPRSLAHA